ILLCQKVPRIWGRSASFRKAPSLGGFRFTPPISTSKVSSWGVTMRLAPYVRNSRLILSPISVATAIIAVATATPRAMATPASNLRRACRRNDSYTRRGNILFLFEVVAARRYVRLRDDHRVAGDLSFERDGIAAAGHADRLRINGR